TNNGDDVLVVSNFMLTGEHPGDFAYEIVRADGQMIEGDTFELAVGESVTINVTFVPTAGGSREGSFTFNTNDPTEEKVTLNFAGLGVGKALPTPKIEITDSSGRPDNFQLGLSSTKVGSTSYAGTYTLRNTGDAVLTVQQLALM